MSITKKNLYFIYGNHDSLTPLEDYYSVLKQLFKYCLNKPLLASDIPVPGHWNILIEYFDEKFVSTIKQMKKQNPDTQFICIATEFKTGNTFNAFFAESNPISKSIFSILNSLRRTGIYIAKKFPFYISMRKYYRKLVPESIRNTGSAHYTINFSYWKKRYESFVNVSPWMDMIWLVSPKQNAGFLELIDPEKIWNFPIIPYTDQIPADSYTEYFPDVDFLFTGTLTSYRYNILRSLDEKGFKVVSGFFPSFLADSYIERAKICLHIKPHENWPFSSNMRLHKLLMAGKFVISESFDQNSNNLIQRDFIEEVSRNHFIDFAVNKVSDPDIINEGLRVRESYIKATKAKRQEVCSEIKKMFGS